MKNIYEKFCLASAIFSMGLATLWIPRASDFSSTDFLQILAQLKEIGVLLTAICFILLAIYFKKNNQDKKNEESK